MSEFSDKLSADVGLIRSGTWSERDGTVVPDTDDLGLDNDGVWLEATMLYSDLADSTELAMLDQQTAAEVYKAFLLVCSRIIKQCNGEVRSFDGDRVMGVFIGKRKNSNSALAALKINWAFKNAIIPTFSSYDIFKPGGFVLRHTTGVDTGRVLVARAGVRVDNDLVWVGRAPNAAAKLSSIRNPKYQTFITSDVFTQLAEDAKIWNGKDMWTKLSWSEGPDGCNEVYGSAWTWSP